MPQVYIQGLPEDEGCKQIHWIDKSAQEETMTRGAATPPSRALFPWLQQWK